MDNRGDPCAGPPLGLYESEHGCIAAGELPGPVGKSLGRLIEGEGIGYPLDDLGQLLKVIHR